MNYLRAEQICPDILIEQASAIQEDIEAGRIDTALEKLCRVDPRYWESMFNKKSLSTLSSKNLDAARRSSKCVASSPRRLAFR